MTRVWLFLHFFGFVFWIGGSLAAMVAGIAARGETRSALGAVARSQSAITRLLIAPGALATVISGLLLTFRNSGGIYPGANLGLILMQGAGLVGGLITLLITVPTVSKLGRLDPEGKTAAYFDELRQRHRLVASIAGVLALTALVGGVMVAQGGYR
jgi:hypothetical protein